MIALIKSLDNVKSKRQVCFIMSDDLCIIDGDLIQYEKRGENIVQVIDLTFPDCIKQRMVWATYRIMKIIT